MSRIGVTAALLVLAFSLAGGAHASRKPSHQEAVAITRAFKTTKKLELNTIADKFDIVRIRVSTVNPHFARGNFVAKPTFRNHLVGFYGVAKRGRNGKWTAISVGNFEVGCIRAIPRKVRMDLKLVCH
jgi:hypothetical protein